MNVNGKIVLVSGASRGIGAAVSIEAAKRGAAKVIMLARNEADMAAVAKKVEGAGAKAICISVDLSLAGPTTEAVRKIITEGNHPDILVNNAGAGRWLFLDETPSEEADFMMQLPFGAALRLTTLLMPGFMKRGSGNILNVGSPASLVPWPGATAYTASRWGLRGLTLALQADLRGSGICVTNFLAGEITSNYFKANPGSHERIPAIAKIIPIMSPEQAAGHILDAIEHDKKSVIVPFMLRLIYWLNGIMPGVVRWVVWKTGYRRAR